MASETTEAVVETTSDFPDWLSSDMITAALAAKKAPKGQYLIDAKNFALTGAYHLDFCSLPQYAGKEPAAVKQSVTTACKKMQLQHPQYPPCSCIVIDDKVLIINLAVHAAKQAAK